MQKPNVIVAHSGVQHSPQAALAFQEYGMLYRYFTSIWYKPNHFPYILINQLPGKLRNLLLRELKKKYNKEVNPELVSQYPYYELISFVLRRVYKNPFLNQYITHWVNRNFDKWITKKIQKMDLDVFIGYEMACLESFKMCKLKGVKCILDLAAPHWTLQKKLYEIEEGKNNPIISISKSLLKEVNSIKTAELNLADLILTPSQYARDSLVEANIDENKIRLIPYGINIEKFTLKPIYKKEKNLNLLYVGPINPAKGLKYLLEAFSQLSLGDSELIIIGTPLGAEQIMKDYKDCFKHVSYTHHDELTAYYQNADVFVFPSIVDSFAMVVLEAMACGTPVIISENTGAKDAARNGIDGFIVPVGDVNAIKEKILYFYNNRNKIEEMGRNARTQAEKYTWEKYRKSIRDVVLEMFGRQ